MTKKQFKIIKYFSPSEVTSTGASLGDVTFRLVFVVDRIREKLGQPVYLLFNGLTTGEHNDPDHPGGRAVDIRVPGVSYIDVIKAALSVGARVIGVYYNGRAFSYHIGIGNPQKPGYRFWRATRIKGQRGEKRWKYGSLFADPKKAV